MTSLQERPPHSNVTNKGDDYDGKEEISHNKDVSVGEESLCAVLSSLRQLLMFVRVNHQG